LFSSLIKVARNLCNRQFVASFHSLLCTAVSEANHALLPVSYSSSFIEDFLSLKKRLCDS
jgi:hypothetical protein